MKVRWGRIRSDRQRSVLGACFAEADHAIPILPLSTFAEQIDPFETLEDASLSKGAGCASLKTVVLRHDEKVGKVMPDALRSSSFFEMNSVIFLPDGF